MNDRGMVSELRCTKHNDADRTIWGEEEGNLGDTQWLAVVAGRTFDLCRWPRNYRCPHSTTAELFVDS